MKVQVIIVFYYERCSKYLLEHTVSGDEFLEQFVLFILTILSLTSWVVQQLGDASIRGFYVGTGLAFVDSHGAIPLHHGL